MVDNDQAVIHFLSRLAMVLRVDPVVFTRPAKELSISRLTGAPALDPDMEAVLNRMTDRGAQEQLKDLLQVLGR